MLVVWMSFLVWEETVSGNWDWVRSTWQYVVYMVFYWTSLMNPLMMQSLYTEHCYNTVARSPTFIATNFSDARSGSVGILFTDQTKFAGCSSQSLLLTSTYVSAVCCGSSRSPSSPPAWHKMDTHRGEPFAHIHQISVRLMDHVTWLTAQWYWLGVWGLFTLDTAGTILPCADRGWVLK